MANEEGEASRHEVEECRSFKKSLGTSSLMLPSSQGSYIDTLRYVMKIKLFSTN